MYVCIYVYIFTHTHTHIHIYICIYFKKHSIPFPDASLGIGGLVKKVKYRCICMYVNFFKFFLHLFHDAGLGIRGLFKRVNIYIYVLKKKIYTFSTTPALGLKALGCTRVIESTPPPIAHGTLSTMILWAAKATAWRERER